MIRELSDRRAICAVRFVDAATEQPLPQPFHVSAPGARFLRNRVGLYVLLAAPGLEEYTREWERPPVAPAVGAIRVTIEVYDPARRYLPRRARLALPRNPSPPEGDDPGSLFRPVTVRMFPSPALSTLPNWAVIHVAVRQRATGEPIAGALLRVTESAPSARVLGRGLTGELGEALVVVSGIRLVSSGEGPDVLVSDVAVTVEGIVDPNAVGLPDPDDLEARRSALPSNAINLSLAAGRTQGATLSLPRENP